MLVGILICSFCCGVLIAHWPAIYCFVVAWLHSGDLWGFPNWMLLLVLGFIPLVATAQWLKLRVLRRVVSRHR